MKCECGKGHCSLIDGKCSHCRTIEEQQAWLSRPCVELKLTVVNKHHGKTGEYIGRGSPLGNPYPITKELPRKEVIAKYEIWLNEQIQKSNPIVLRELERIGAMALNGAVTLQCFCSPLPCHGDVIRKVVHQAIAINYPETRWELSGA